MRIGHNPFDHRELTAVIRVLLSGHMTYGVETDSFEREWSGYLGSDNYSVMVNSGSSANLLALSALAYEGRIPPDSEVIVPAVAWSTTIFPIAQVGATPVLVDIDPKTLNISPAAIEAAITPRTSAIMLVHLLGNPCDMDAIMRIAKKHDLAVIEDCCEAHGAAIRYRKVGNFGDASTFSFFFAHHMTSIEGGIVSTKDAERADNLRSMRSHGWVRERSDRREWEAMHPDVDPRWLFVTPGYNLRPTDLQAAFAREQLKRVSSFVATRMARWERLAAFVQSEFSDHLTIQHYLPEHRHSAFGFALLCRDNRRDALQRHLEGCGIETRPIISGSFVRQPALARIPHRLGDSLQAADFVHDHGLMLPCHQDTTTDQQDHLFDCLRGFFGG